MNFESQPINVGDDAQAVLRAHALMLAEHNGYYSQVHARLLNPDAGAFARIAGVECQLAPGRPLPPGRVDAVYWRTCAGNELMLEDPGDASVVLRAVGRRHGIPWSYGVARGLMTLWREQGGKVREYETQTPWADPEAAGVDPASPPDWWARQSGAAKV